MIIISKCKMAVAVKSLGVQCAEGTDRTSSVQRALTVKALLLKKQIRLSPRPFASPSTGQITSIVLSDSRWMLEKFAGRRLPSLVLAIFCSCFIVMYVATSASASMFLRHHGQCCNITIVRSGNAQKRNVLSTQREIRVGLDSGFQWLRRPRPHLVRTST